MDDLKCKKGNAANKKSDFLMKLRGKKKRKSKGKENFKTLKTAPKSSKPNIREDVGRVRIKGGRGMEGMFFKGLRSEYISRDSLNEANEARKKEDLNKIIDIGRAFLERRGRPWRFALNFEGWGRDSASRASKHSLEEELENFSQQYEETVEEQVLLRLPEDGVLEDAVRALREMRIWRTREADGGRRGCLMKEHPNDGVSGGENFIESSEHPFSELEFLTENFETILPEDNFIHEIVSPEKIFASENYSDDDFMGKPLNRMLITTDVEWGGNHRHSSFMTSFDTESFKNDVFHFQEKNFETPAKELNIATPSIQFYRRNMF